MRSTAVRSASSRQFTHLVVVQWRTICLLCAVAMALGQGPPGRKCKDERMAKFDVFKDLRGKWRWRLIASNGKKIATSGESFDSRSNAIRAARNVKRLAPDATIPLMLRLPPQPPRRLR